MLQIFWIIHDPTTINRQGNDVGEQYRSVVLYDNDTQKQVVENSLDYAEHHNYFQTHPEQSYCQLVINPKLQKLRSKFASKLKDDY